jgi:lysozyme
MGMKWPFLAVFLVGCSGRGVGEDTGRTSEAVQECAPHTVEGVDVFGGDGTIVWSSVKAAGIDFAMIKATQGTYNTQSTFAADWSGSKAAGLLRSAYHFFDPTEDGTAQAQHFLSVAGSGAPGDLPPMLDIECPDGDANCVYTGNAGQATAAEIHQRMWDFLNAVETATGKKPIVYTFHSYFTSNGIDTTGLQAYPLFIADITDAGCFDVPAPWTSATIWQYSWSGQVNGIASAVDRDRFIGMLADLMALASGPTDGGDGGEAGRGAGSADGGVNAGQDAGAGEDAAANSSSDAAGDAEPDVPTDDGTTMRSSDVSPASASRHGSTGCACFAAGRGEANARGWYALFGMVLGASSLVARRARRVLAGPCIPCRRPTSAKG